MAEIVVVVVISTAEQKTGDAEALVRNLAARTHDEPGCVRFALHRDQNDPTTLVLVERWADRASLDAHLALPHLAEFRAALAPFLRSPSALYVLDPVPAGDAAKGVL